MIRHGTHKFEEVVVPVLSRLFHNHEGCMVEPEGKSNAAWYNPFIALFGHCYVIMKQLSPTSWVVSISPCG